MKGIELSADARPSWAVVSGFGCFLVLGATGCFGEPGGDLEVSTVQQNITGGWTPLTLINGWQTYPGSAAPAIGIVDGVVRLRGAIRGLSATSAIAFQIPPSFRSIDCFHLRATMGTSSGGRVQYGCDLFAGQGPATFHMQINQDGYGSETEPGPDARAFTSLDGLSYDKDVYTATPIELAGTWLLEYSFRLGGSGSEGNDVLYAKLVGGVVRLQGNVRQGTSEYIGQLPPNMRPINATVYLPVTLCNSYGRLIIHSTGNIYVWPESGAWADASCGVSLEGTSFGVSGSSTPMTLQNGWQNYTPRLAKLRMNGGVVHFEGSIWAGTSTTITTLPSSMRPPTTVRVVADAYNAQDARLLIEPSGAVKVTGLPLSVTSGFTSLDGASFAF